MIQRESKSTTKSSQEGKARRFIGHKSKTSTGKKRDHGVNPCPHSKLNFNNASKPKTVLPKLISVKKKNSFTIKLFKVKGIGSVSGSGSAPITKKDSSPHGRNRASCDIKMNFQFKSKQSKSRKNSIAKRLIRLRDLAGFEFPENVVDEEPKERKQSLIGMLSRRISSLSRFEKALEESKPDAQKFSVPRKLSDFGRSKIAYEESKSKLRKHSPSKSLRARFANNYGPVAQIAPEKHGETDTVADDVEEESNAASPLKKPVVQAKKSGCDVKCRPQKSFLPVPMLVPVIKCPNEVDVEEEPVAKMKYSHITFYGGLTASELQHQEVITDLMREQEYQEKLEDIRRLKRKHRKRQNAAIWKTTALFATIMATFGIKKKPKKSEEEGIGTAPSDNISAERRNFKPCFRLDSDYDSGDDEDAELYDAVGQFRH